MQMNYDELVYSGEKATMQIVKMPIGVFHRKHTGNRLTNIIELNEHVVDNTVILSCIKDECSAIHNILNKHQIHFEQESEETPTQHLCVESGNFISVANILRDTPAIIASPGFLGTLISDLLEFTSYLNSRGIYHLCFSPDNVFVRKGDNNVMLLSHGSFYLNAIDSKILYDGFDDYVAPEVLNGGMVDDRSEVYSIGKFLEYLLTFAEKSYKYNKLLKRSICEVPEDRYQTVYEMSRELKNMEKIKKTATSCAVILCVSALIIGSCFVFMQSSGNTTVPISGVNLSIKADSATTIQSIDSQIELDMDTESDTCFALPEYELLRQKEYEDKCEQIFRKKYTKEADRILSKIYNNSHMGSNEKKFVAANQTTIDELVKVQEQLAEQSNISKARSLRLATEIIDEITERKKKALTSYGIQK